MGAQKTCIFNVKIKKKHACGCLSKVTFVNLAGFLLIKVQIEISSFEGLFLEVAKVRKLRKPVVSQKRVATGRR